MKNFRLSKHVETGSVDTREGWVCSYPTEELEARGLTAEQAFEEDEGKTLIEVEGVMKSITKTFHGGEVVIAAEMDKDFETAIERIRQSYREQWEADGKPANVHGVMEVSAVEMRRQPGVLDVRLRAHCFDVA